MHKLLTIPSKTHCKLLHLIVNDISVKLQIHKRFLKFFHSVISSDNEIIKMCDQLMLTGSRSTVCNTINYIWSKIRNAIL